jgi:hypothetical protein
MYCGGTMGKVTIRFRATNYDDLAANKARPGSRVERVFDGEGLVDTGAVRLYLQRSVIARLGLEPVDRIRSRTMSNRVEDRQVYSPVRMEGTYDWTRSGIGSAGAS